MSYIGHIPPIRRIAFRIGEINNVWQRVAVQAEPGVWCWDCSDMDRERIDREKEAGRMTTTWETRGPEETWLLVRRV